MAYRIRFARDVEEHLKSLTARQRAIVVEGMKRHLLVGPDEETRNKKRLRSNPIAPWELRLGALRVFYDVTSAPEELVDILAVGTKTRTRLRLGSKDVEL